MTNNIWITAISDLLINLSAGWFGAVIIVPNFSRQKGTKRWLILTGDLLAGIVCLAMAVAFRGLV